MKHTAFFITFLLISAVWGLANAANPDPYFNTDLSSSKDLGQKPGGQSTTATGDTTESPVLDDVYNVAIISGVPRYYQKEVSCSTYDQITCVTLEETVPTGCGPVAGATILAWWDRIGYDDLVDENDVDEDGMPENLIVQLGQKDYMHVYGSNFGTAVLPKNFVKGLQAYIEEKGYFAEIHRYRIKEAGTFEELDEDKNVVRTLSVDEMFEILKDEIRHGRPLVYALRHDGATRGDGTFKFINHYVTVVGYDNTDGDYNLIVQPNWASFDHWGLNATTSLYNRYKGSTEKIRLSDYTSSNYLRYNLFTIKITSSQPVSAEGQCKGLTITGVLGSAFHLSPKDKCNLLDGYHNNVYSPYIDNFTSANVTTSNMSFRYGATDQLAQWDGECLVAGWYDRSYTAPQSVWDQDGDSYSDGCDYPELFGKIGTVRVVYDSTTGKNYVTANWRVGNSSPSEAAGAFKVKVKLTSDDANLRECLPDLSSKGNALFSGSETIGLLDMLSVEGMDKNATSDWQESNWTIDLGSCGIDRCIEAKVILSVDCEDQVEELSEIAEAQDDEVLMDLIAGDSDNYIEKSFRLCPNSSSYSVSDTPIEPPVTNTLQSPVINR